MADLRDAAQKPVIGVHVYVEGRVQGVGYRYFLRGCARRLGVAGWVRNRSDGSVEALVFGPADRVERVLGEMRRGPPGGEVTHVRAVAADEKDDWGDAGLFAIRPTV